MKLLLKIARWLLGSFLFLLGLVFLSEKLSSAMMFLISGTLIVPVFSHKIKLFQKRKFLIPVVAVMLFFIGVYGLGMSEESKTASTNVAEQPKAEETMDYTQGTSKTEENSTTEEKNKIEKNDKVTKQQNEDPSPKKKSDSEAKKENMLSEDEIKKWISKNVGYEVSKKKKEKFLTRVDEPTFFTVWRRDLYSKISSEEMTFSSLRSETKEYLELYTQLFGSNSESVRKISKYIDKLDKLDQEKYDIGKNYDFYLKDSVVFSDNFYILNRLETRYQDNISGRLQKEIDSYNQKPHTEWLARNVEYNSIFGSTPGDEKFVIRTSGSGTFSKQGSYWLSYVSTNKTLDLIDQNGFESKAPILYLVEHPEQAQQDILSWNSSNTEFEKLHEELMHYLDTGKSLQVNSNSTHSNKIKNDKGMNSDYILPTNSEYVSYEDLNNLTGEFGDEIIRYAINEIYARHGYVFKTEKYAEYFSSQEWYTPDANLSDAYIKDALFNDYEKENLKILLSYEKEFLSN